MLTSSFLSFFLLLLLLLVLTAKVQGHTMTIRMNPTVTGEGATVEIECHVTDMRGSSLFVVWFRRAPVGKEVELATSGHVNEVFRKTGRYKASHRYEDNATVSYSLTISDAKTSDSGEIGCRIPNSFEIFKVLSVTTPVSKLQLTSTDDGGTCLFASGDVATFSEGTTAIVMCKVNASYPQPVITMTTGTSDISHLFQVRHRLVSAPSSRWLPAFYYESVAVPRRGELLMRYSMDRRNLTCTAWHQGSLSPPARLSIVIRIDKYLPKFDCPSGTEARLYQESFKFLCSVHANPGIERAVVSWTKFAVFTQTIFPNSSVGNYRLRVEFGPNQTEMVFSIDRMFPQTFRTYRFEASNSMGTTTQEVVVREAVSHPVSGGKKLRGSSSASTFLVLFGVPLFFAKS